MRLKVARLAAALLLWCVCSAEAQTAANQNPPSQPQPAPRSQYFAGTVVEIAQDHITVSRTLVGKLPEKRNFATNEKTIMSKSVKVKSRVIVRYQHLEDSDTALEVRLRPSTRPKK